MLIEAMYKFLGRNCLESDPNWPEEREWHQQNLILLFC